MTIVEQGVVLPGSAGEHALQDLSGSRDRAAAFYRDQMLDHLNPRMREFIARQELLFVATADASGNCDCTLRAGPAGFVRVLDERCVAYPEYRGNGVMASLGNMVENPHAALFFVDFVRDVIGLHVNGRARLVEPEEAAGLGLGGEGAAGDEAPPPGRRAHHWVVLDVEEAYIHCAKHIPRLAKVPREIHWGTDDQRRKGGDFFGAAAQRGERAAAIDEVIEGAEREGAESEPDADARNGSVLVDAQPEAESAARPEPSDPGAEAEFAACVDDERAPAEVAQGPDSSAASDDEQAPAKRGFIRRIGRRLHGAPGDE